MATDNKKINSFERTMALNDTILGGVPITAPTTPQTDLGAVLNDKAATWNFSKDGGTGAMLVQTGVEVSGGAAIKVEDPVNARQVQKCAQVMDTFFQNAQGQPPFAAPRVQVYSTNDLLQNPQLSNDLTAKLKDLKENGPADIQVRVDRQIAKLDDVAAGKGTVVKMEFAAGKMMNQLSGEDRVALYKTDAFAQNLGRSMPTFVALGMNDHLGVDTFKNNAANLMFDTQTGKISAIDFSTAINLNPVDTNNNDLVTFSQQGGDKAIQSLDSFLANATKDQASFDQAVETLAQGKRSPLKDMMDSFTVADWKDNMFPPADAAIVKAEISMDDKRRFAANLLSGTVDGLDYLKQNQQALRTAVQATHETVNGVKLEHFYNQEKMDAFCAAVQQVDTQGMRQKTDLHMSKMRLETCEEKAAYIQDKIKALDQKIDHLENKPSLRDRLNFLVNGKDKVLGELKAERAQLDESAKNLIKDAQKLINLRDGNDATKGPQVPAVAQQDHAAPRAKVGQVFNDPARAQVAASLESRLRAPALAPASLPVATPAPAVTGSSSSSNAKVGDDLNGPKVAAKSEALNDGPALDGDVAEKKGGKLSQSEEMVDIMKRLEDKLKPATVSLPNDGTKVGGLSNRH